MTSTVLGASSGTFVKRLERTTTGLSPYGHFSKLRTVSKVFLPITSVSTELKNWRNP